MKTSLVCFNPYADNENMLLSLQHLQAFARSSSSKLIQNVNCKLFTHFHELLLANASRHDLPTAVDQATSLQSMHCQESKARALYVQIMSAVQCIMSGVRASHHLIAKHVFATSYKVWQMIISVGRLNQNMHYN